MITTVTRAHLMAARDDVSRAGDGHPSVDLALVAAHIDRALQALCPHLPETWTTRSDEQGRCRTTCYACGTFWYDHERTDQQDPHAAERQQAAFMALLELRLKTRIRDHGFAYVTTIEGERLRADGLYQPGHTIHRFSVPSEDRSDSALAALALDASLGNTEAFPNAG